MNASDTFTITRHPDGFEIESPMGGYYMDHCSLTDEVDDIMELLPDCVYSSIVGGLDCYTIEYNPDFLTAVSYVAMQGFSRRTAMAYQYIMRRDGTLWLRMSRWTDFEEVRVGIVSADPETSFDLLRRALQHADVFDNIPCFTDDEGNDCNWPHAHSVSPTLRPDDFDASIDHFREV